MSRARASLAGWAVLAARLLLGGVLISAGVLKLPDPAESVRAVRAFQALPEVVVPTVGYGLPVLEVVVGAMLVLGIAVRLSAVVGAVLMVAFTAGIASAWARGLTIDCGCFGGGGEVAAGETEYGTEILRDGGLLLVAALLVRWPDGRLSLTRHAAAPRPDEADLDDDQAEEQPWPSVR